MTKDHTDAASLSKKERAELRQKSIARLRRLISICEKQVWLSAAGAVCAAILLNMEPPQESPSFLTTIERLSAVGFSIAALLGQANLRNHKRTLAEIEAIQAFVAEKPKG